MAWSLIKMVVYDKLKWHYEADSMPEDLEEEAAGTHIAFYLRWCIENDFLSEEFIEDIEITEDEINNMKSGKSDVRQFLMDDLDGVLTSEELNDEGGIFSNAYYGDDKSKFAKKYGDYLSDYGDFTDKLLGKKYSDENRYYYVEYNDENYLKVKNIIDKRYKEFLEMNKK